MATAGVEIGVEVEVGVEVKVDEGIMQKSPRSVREILLGVLGALGFSRLGLEISKRGRRFAPTASLGRSREPSDQICSGLTLDTLQLFLT